MSNEILPPIPGDIAKLTGPVLLGNFFNWGLLGALGVQAYIYYLGFPEDRFLPKLLVSSVVTIEVLQTILVTRDAFRSFGTGWGNMIILNDVAWLWFSVPVMTAIISCAAQLFFAWRIYVLSHHKPWIPAIVIALSVTQFVAGVWSGIEAHIIGQFSEIQNHNYIQTSVWLGGTALVDTVITVSMIAILYRSRSGFRATNTVVTKFIRLTVETGLICATFAILDLSFFLRFKDFNYHLAPAIALSKLYSNSILVLLNARIRLVGGRDRDSASTDPSLSFMKTGNTDTLGSTAVHQLSLSKPPPGSVVIDVEVNREESSEGIPMVHSSAFHKSPRDYKSFSDV